MAASVVGRDAELASIRDFVGGIADGASALVLEGEAGMGKTTLWRTGVETAQAGDALVLAAQPAESETALSFSGLGDLLDGLLDEALAPLPGGQRSALSRALVLEEVSGPPPDAHAAGVALLNALRGLAGPRPVLVAVDDVQWLDAASAGAIAFAARRLRGESARLLLARRSGLETALVDEVRRSFADGRSVTVEVGPLDLPALHDIVQGHLGTTLPRPLLAEVHQASGGNPFFALEIVRTLQRSDVSVEAGQPLPVPDSLHALVHARLLALPSESRYFLAAAAAHARPTLSITEDASAIDRLTGLPPALDAGVVETHGDDIRFTHPLLATAALETADPRRRAEIHSRLAQLLEDPEARAWQLAACTRVPDEEIAAALEGAAVHARARGAPRPAALLLHRAAELTPLSAGDASMRRAVDACYLHFEAGDASRAERGLRELIPSLPAGDQRARALCVLAKIRSYEAADEAAQLFLRVIDEREGDAETIARAHEGVAASLWIDTRRLDEALRHAQKAVDMALAIGDDALGADALISQLGAELWLGRESAPETAERALALQSATEDRRLNDQPLVALVEYWLLTGQHDESRRLLEAMLLRADSSGDESSRPYLLFLLAWAEGRTGELRRAFDRAQQGRDAAEQSGQPVFAGYNVALGAVHAAQLGEPEAVLIGRNDALALAPRNGHVELMTTAAVGHLELARGDRRAAAAILRQVRLAAESAQIGEPEVLRFVIDEVEALRELGEDAEARRLLDGYEDRARRLGRTASRANCARCRGLLAAHEGDLDGALAAFDDALQLHAEVDLPLDRGRTLLALGAAQRRAKRRREARATLEEALRLFERIGAALWAERARIEMKRISGRAATPGGLTPAEQRVAALVAEGRTNREVAAALFLSERTVEGHLSRIFGKLGIRHRTEIASVLSSAQTQGVGVSNTGGAPVSAESTPP